MVLQLSEPIPFALQHPGNRHAGPRGDDLRHVFSRHFFLEESAGLLESCQVRLRLRKGLAISRKLAVGDLGRRLEVARARSLLGRQRRFLEAPLELANPVDGCLLGQPVPLQAGQLLPDAGQIRFERLEPRARLRVGLALQCLALDLQLRPPALQHVDRLGHGIDLDAES